MFLEYYGLREQPFGVTPDPRYLFLTPARQEAFAALVYGIETGRGFLALIGPPGTGKTTLLFQLLDRLHDSTRTAFLFQTQCDSREFFRYLLADLGIEPRDQNLAHMHAQLNDVLLAEAKAGRRLVMIIDEAQDLDESVLETVRLLSNFETTRAKLLQIVLSGQPRLAEKLASPALLQLRQRISILSRVDPLTAAETSRYVDYRLSIAGYEGPSLFTPEARAMIFSQSHGIPRDINNLCFNALSIGCAVGKKIIDGPVLEEVVRDLDLGPLQSRQPGLNRTIGSPNVPANLSAGTPGDQPPANDAPAEFQAARASTSLPPAPRRQEAGSPALSSKVATDHPTLQAGVGLGARQAENGAQNSGRPAPKGPTNATRTPPAFLPVAAPYSTRQPKVMFAGIAGKRRPPRWFLWIVVLIFLSGLAAALWYFEQAASKSQRSSGREHSHPQFSRRPGLPQHFLDGQKTNC